MTEVEEDARFDRLESETRRLNGSIQGLTNALVNTSEIQAKLAGLDERQRLVEGTVIPRSEVEEKISAARIEQAAYRRRMVRRLTIAISTIGLLVAALIGGAIFAGRTFQRDQQQFKALQYDQCIRTQQATRTFRQYIGRQRDAELASTDAPDIKNRRLDNFDGLLRQYPEPNEKCGQPQLPPGVS